MTKNKIEIPLGTRTVSVECGLLAKQAHGSALVTCGESMVLVTAVTSGKPYGKGDYFPLLVDYREQTSAAGRFPGGFFKREGRPTEKETLVSRMIDRSLRPLFPIGFINEVQIVALVFSADPENDNDTLAMIGASAALTASPIPFGGPVGAVRVGLLDEQLVINPTIPEIQNARMNLVISGTEHAIIMLEGWAKQISEELFMKAVSLGHGKIKEMIAIQKAWLGEKTPFTHETDPAMQAAAEELLLRELPKAYEFKEKNERGAYYATLEEQFLAAYDEEKQPLAKQHFSLALEDRVRRMILETGKRLDGRSAKEIRPISAQIGFLPRTHGSALFTRGQTQCLASITLGSRSDEQIIDGLLEESSKRFMVHYNFPGFSVGEVSPMRGPGRREIGHGALAEKALINVLPPADKFPYTIRIVANILESNGSSSMATTCAGSLSLMEAGVPIPGNVGGVSVGLVIEGNKHLVLTDIAGEEDHYGDMDLKIAGTKEGITAVQMDVKCGSVTEQVLADAVGQSHEARLSILGVMDKVIVQPKPDIYPLAPRIITLHINQSKIGLVIGPGGKNIRGIVERTGVKIDIEDDGSVNIASNDAAACEKAIAEIKGLTDEAEVGKIYDGTVTRILNFGCFVKILPNQEGMVHISELALERINSVEDVVKVGDTIKVKVMNVDDQGRVNLSARQTFPPEELAKYPAPAPRPPRSSGPRGGDRGGRDRRPPRR